MDFSKKLPPERANDPVTMELFHMAMGQIAKLGEALIQVTKGSGSINDVLISVRQEVALLQEEVAALKEELNNSRH